VNKNFNTTWINKEQKKDTSTKSVCPNAVYSQICYDLYTDAMRGSEAMSH